LKVYSIIIVSAAAKTIVGTADCSLSGLGSSGESSKICVGRAAKLRWVKMRSSISADSIFGSLGRPSGPKSGLGEMVSLRDREREGKHREVPEVRHEEKALDGILYGFQVVV
jgi:hypothetical protein